MELRPRDLCPICRLPLKECDCEAFCPICEAPYVEHDNDGYCPEEALARREFIQVEVDG